MDKPSPRSYIAYDVVVMGASLGGIQAFNAILSALPLEFPLPIVVVQHLSPHHPSLLHEVLSRHTRLRVRQAREGEALQCGTVYTPVPNHHLLINSECALSLGQGPRVQYSRPAIDVLFHSAVATFGRRALGVVLTGANGDGAAGIQAIREAGGSTIAQDEATSQCFRMPHTAIDTECVNFVLPIHKIASALIALTMVRGAAEFFRVPSRTCYPALAHTILPK